MKHTLNPYSCVEKLRQSHRPAAARLAPVLRFWVNSVPVRRPTLQPTTVLHPTVAPTGSRPQSKGQPLPPWGMALDPELIAECRSGEI